MIRRLAVLARLAATTAVQQYGPVVLSMAVALALSVLLRRYVYPRPLFLLALVLSGWGRGLGPSLVGAGVAIITLRDFFPGWLPEYGLLSDTAVFSLAAAACSAFSSTKLRAEQQRKLAEEQLRLSERRLRLALSAAHLGAWAVDLSTNIIAISGDYSKMYGLAHDRPSLTFQEWLALVHPDDRGRVRALLRETVEQTHTWDAEFRVVWPDGSTHWLLGKGTVLPDETGRPIRMAGVNLDITERKQAEELRSHLAAIVESSDDGIIGKTLDGTIVSWNFGAERLYGYKAEEMVGRPISMLAPSDHLYEIPHILEEIRHGECIVHYETEGIRKDGQRIDVSLTISPIKDRAGTIIGASMIARDITERKRAEASLRESEERFRDMADTAPVMIWISGQDKLCTFFNKSWLDFTGRTMEQELANGWAEGVHPEDLDRCLATYSSSFDARSSFQMGYRFRRADGQYRWLLDNGIPLYREGEFAGYIGSCIDVTDQKVTEERLRASEVQLMDAQRLAKVGSWERRIEADAIIHWSDEMLRILGLPSSAPSNFKAFLSYVHPADREKILESDYKVRSSLGPLGVEYRILPPDGDARFVRSIVEAVRNDQGAPVRIVGATQDITEQVKARELLRDSEERLKNAERLAHVGHWDWDMKTDRMLWSEEICRIFGRPLDYTTDYAGFLQTVYPHDRDRVDQAARHALGGKSPHSLEFEIIRADGEVRMVACIFEVLPDEAGSPVHLFGACQDITDQRRSEVALRRNLDEMAHLNRVAAMGELTASIAHEINQPLAAILSNAQAASRFLNGDSPDLAQARECLTDIVADDKRAGEVINRLRGLLKKGEFQESLVNLNEVVSDALRMVRNDSLRRHVTVVFEPSPNLPAVLGDRVQLYQVVLNLVVNGLEASPEQGPDERWLKVRTAESSGGTVEITVEDSGRGIAARDLDRVFEPFFTTKPDGLGMGLSISRSIVQAHRGRLWAENSATGGAMFRCVLPAAQRTAAAAP